MTPIEPENVPEEDFTTITDVESIYDLFNEGKITLAELDRLKAAYFQWYYSEKQHLTVMRFYRQPEGYMTIHTQTYVPAYGENSNSDKTEHPTENYYHGTYSAEDVADIVSEGLIAGSSISSWKGQATSYPIIFEYADLVVVEISYRPGDFTLLQTSERPVAIYVDVVQFGEGVRTIDEVNTELASILERLEVQGTASPERVGSLIADKDYVALKELDERLPHIAKEMDAAIDRGPSPGGEGILKRVVEQASGIPVYRIDRDEEGDIDWNSKRLTSG